jgi:urate oxidase
MALGSNSWGKSAVRVSKIHHHQGRDDFSDVTVEIRLEGDVAAAHTDGDNRAVLPTDTMRNTVYAMAQKHLTKDLESFGIELCHRFLGAAGVTKATVSVWEWDWARERATGFIGGGSERRLAAVTRGSEESCLAGIEGLVLLKTTGSAFTGFPRDEFTVLPEAEDRLLATSVTAEWVYSRLPTDTTATWARVRKALVDSFFDTPSASVQHQGYMMGEAVLAAIAEIDRIEMRLPNQHHLPFDVERFGVAATGTVFQPVTEPFGDIRLTVTRD